MTPSNTLRAERLRIRARQQMATGQLRAAQATLEALLLRVPRDLLARLELARLLTRCGQWKASIQPLLLSPDEAPNVQPELAIELAKELLTRGELVRARAWLDTIERMPRNSAMTLRVLAGLRAMLGEVELARDLIERALAGGVDDRIAHHVHGLMLKFDGDLEGARKVFRQNFSRWPDDVDSAIELAGVMSTPDHTLLAQVERKLRELAGVRDTPTSTYAAAGFQYIRFRILDALDRRDEAWTALCACNTRMHKLRPYPAQAVEAVTGALLRFPVREENMVDAHLYKEHIPVFIVGMPRSGTTLLEHMLSAHSEVASAGEIVDFETQLRVLADVAPGRPEALAEAIEHAAGIDFAELGTRYLTQTRWRTQQHRFLIDKLPQNLRMVGFIRRALPQARIIHIVRDPMDVCFSNLAMMFPQAGAYSYDIDAMSHYHRQYERLAAHWQRTLPGAMLEVDYAGLVTNPIATLRRTLTYLGLEMEAGCLCPESNVAPVQSPSSAQVRAPINTARIGRWRRYAKPLQGLADELSCRGTDA